MTENIVLGLENRPKCLFNFSLRDLFFEIHYRIKKLKSSGKSNFNKSGIIKVNESLIENSMMNNVSQVTEKLLRMARLSEKNDDIM